MNHFDCGAVFHTVADPEKNLRLLLSPALGALVLMLAQISLDVLPVFVAISERVPAKKILFVYMNVCSRQ